MDKESWKAVSNLQDFARNLTEVDVNEIEQYTTEIVSNREFYNQLEENRSHFGDRAFSSWVPGIGKMLGTVVYVLCRVLKPDTIVETGVAGGVSSSYILCALEENEHGELCSIDLPWRGNQSGWIIPDYLRHRWQLVVGRSSERLLPLLERLGTIDIFLHDSEHSYQNMLWEYQTAWVFLRSGGLLLSHNTDMSDAFPHSCQSLGVRGFVLSDMGGVIKA